MLLRQVFVMVAVLLDAYLCSGDFGLSVLRVVNLNGASIDLLRGYLSVKRNESINDQSTLMSSNKRKFSDTEVSKDALQGPIIIVSSTYDNHDPIMITRATIFLECIFPDLYHRDYDNISSRLYQEYSSNMVSKIRAGFLKGILTLNKIDCISLSRGSVIANVTMDVSSNTTMNTSQIDTTVISAVTDAFNGSVNVTTISVTTSTSTTVSSPSSTTNIAGGIFTSGKPAEMGEYAIQVNLVCKFNDSFIGAYNNSNSSQYQSYVNNVKKTFLASTVFQGVMRLIDISFNSLSPGSVIANMQMNVASSSSDPNMISSALISATIQAFPSSSVISVTTNYLSLIGSTPIPMSTRAPKIGEWAFALMAIVGLGLVLLLVVTVTAIVVHVHSKDKTEIKYVGPTTSGFVNEGLVLETYCDYSKHGKMEVKETKT